MKIVCLGCKRVIGEKAPYRTEAEVKAYCVDCMDKANRLIANDDLKLDHRDGQEVIFDNGIKGTLCVAKTKKDKLNLGEFELLGEKFMCSDDDRDRFHKQLENVSDEYVNISFFHSISCDINSQSKRRRKCESLNLQIEKVHESIQYNCTIRVSKQLAQSMFDGMTKRMQGICDILLRPIIDRLQD